MQTLTSHRPIVYESLSKLGEGTFSTVFRALRRDREFGIQQEVALKILKSQIHIETWKEEFASLELVKSEKCVRVLGWDVLGGDPALILEWVDGVTLGQIVRSGPLSTSLIDEITLQIREGLLAIHKSGLVHGDLSLQNVMLTKKGGVKLLDFGLSKAHVKAFTPEFAAPELINQEEATAQSDLYSLGKLREFLERRSKLPLSFTTKELLHVNQTDRHFELLFEPLEHERQGLQRELAKRVEKLSEKSEPAVRSPQTVMRSKTPGFLKNALLLGLTSLALGSAPSAPYIKDAYLTVKTTKWLAIKVDGVPRGYAPLEVSVRALAEHRIEWKGANNHGQRTLTLKPGQNMVMTDAFFK